MSSSPTVAGASAAASDSGVSRSGSSRAHGHSHSHGSHGHSHGGGKKAAHGHSHASAASSGSHGHSHSSSESHGHSHSSESSHGPAKKASSSHGHSHAGEECHGHAHSEGKEHGHGGGKDARAEAAAKATRQLLIAIVLCFIFMIAEVVGGYYARSIAILTDAAHMLSDVAGLVIGVFAVCVAQRPASPRMTFGCRRFEVFGALVSVLIIWILVGILIYEAILRVQNPEEVDGRLMFFVATGGFVVNIALMRVLHQGHNHGGHGGSHEDEHDDHAEDHHDDEDAGCCDRLLGCGVRICFGQHAHSHSHGGGGGGGGGNVNVRAAFIHAVGDLLQSIGVMIAAGLIWYNPEWRIADPICTFIFSALVMWTTFGIVREATGVLLMSAPAYSDTEGLLADLEKLPGVANVHDLHVWSLSSGSDIVMTVHIVADDPQATLAAAMRIAAKHGIGHSTIQIERCGTSDLGNCWKYNESCHMELPWAAGSASSSVSAAGEDDLLSLNGSSSRKSATRPLLEGGRDEDGHDGSSGTSSVRRGRSLGLRARPGAEHVGCELTASAAASPLAAASGRGEPAEAAAAATSGHGHSHGGVACHGHGHSHGHDEAEDDHGDHDHAH